jgi:threonylcarbamoyladenosine tRNA methylthiotransferase MtaB
VGLEPVKAGQEADLYIVNTCTVTARADHKARACLRALARAHPGSLIVATGCGAQVEPGTFARLAPNIVVVPQSRKAQLLDLRGFLDARHGAGDAAGERAREPDGNGVPGDPFAFVAREQSFRTRVFLKIQDGCAGRCAYCRVPLARGGPVSLPPAEVVRRAAECQNRGASEIVLTGVNICAWRAEGLDLPGLIGRLLEEVPRVRFRLSSVEPEGISEELAAVIAHPRICAHFHIPVQSGSDSVLRRMNRKYRAETVIEGVRLLRRVKEDPFIAADILVGFPGETDSEYAATEEIVRDLAFAAVHVFPFSPRPGTPAAAMRPPVLERVRTARAREISLIGAAISDSYVRGWLGRDAEALIEGPAAAGMRGVTGNYLRVLMSGVPGGENATGRLARVTITRTGRICVARFDGFCG